jgi:hypothetical protein
VGNSEKAFFPYSKTLLRTLSRHLDAILASMLQHDGAFEHFSPEKIRGFFPSKIKPSTEKFKCAQQLLLLFKRNKA